MPLRDASPFVAERATAAAHLRATLTVGSSSKRESGRADGVGEGVGVSEGVGAEEVGLDDVSAGWSSALDLSPPQALSAAEARAVTRRPRSKRCPSVRVRDDVTV